MAVLRSALFALLFYPITALFSLTAVVVTPLGRRQLVAVVRGWARFHHWCAKLILAVDSRVEGAIPNRPVLVAAKHQSMYETVELVLVLGNPVPVLKRELADLPLWGRAVRSYGAIPVDREGGGPALRRMLHAAARAKAEGRQILIFPEGTRVSVGERPPLQPGFAGLYRALGLPVVPVALDSGRLWPRQRFLKRPGRITLRFGEEIPAGLSRVEIEEAVHRAINALEQPS